MRRGVFGWDLPPGCTMRDIERAYGDEGDEEEGEEEDMPEGTVPAQGDLVEFPWGGATIRGRVHHQWDSLGVLMLCVQYMPSDQLAEYGTYYNPCADQCRIIELARKSAADPQAVALLALEAAERRIAGMRQDPDYDDNIMGMLDSLLQAVTMVYRLVTPEEEADSCPF